VVTLAGAILAAVLIPLFTRQWQDRQKELDLKRALVAQIAESSSTAVRGAISVERGRLRAAGGDVGERADDVYGTLLDAWLVQRATTESMIATYFPDLGDCWFKYSDAISDFVEMAPAVRKAASQPGSQTQAPGKARAKVDKKRAPKVKELKGYIDDTQECQQIDKLPLVEQGHYDGVTNWKALKSTDNKQFRGAYEKLGPALLIGRDGIVKRIVASDARGFSHGPFHHWF
jgi:hypothetical protein